MVKDTKTLEDYLKSLSKVAIIVAIVIILALSAVYYVPDGEVGVVFNKMGSNQGFDAIERGQGFGLKVPFMQVVHKMPFRTQEIGFFGVNDKRGTYSMITPKDKNGINFNTDITIRYRLDPTQAAEFIEQKGRGTAAMDTLLATAARADSTRGVFGKYAQEEVPLNRIEIATEVKRALQERLDTEGSGKLKAGFIVIEAVDIRNVEFNPKIEERIIQKQIRLQEAEEMEYQVTIAEKTKEMELINAERDKQAAILRAEGEGESIKIVAFAKAEGLDAVNTAYQGMPKEYVLTKFAEAIKDTDKMYFGFDSLGGNQLNFLDMNQVMAPVVKEKAAEADN